MHTCIHQSIDDKNPGDDANSPNGSDNGEELATPFPFFSVSDMYMWNLQNYVAVLHRICDRLPSLHDWWIMFSKLTQPRKRAHTWPHACAHVPCRSGQLCRLAQPQRRAAPRAPPPEAEPPSGGSSFLCARERADVCRHHFWTDVCVCVCERVRMCVVIISVGSELP